MEKLLAANWPNLIGEDKLFWSSEWVKHGTCAEQELSKVEYFQLALHIHYKTNLRQILAKEKIVPDEKHLYNVTSVVAAIREHTQHDPELDCFVDTAKNHTALFQVSVCLSRDGSSYVSCPDTRGSCLQPQLLFPKD